MSSVELFLATTLLSTIAASVGYCWHHYRHLSARHR